MFISPYVSSQSSQSVLPKVLWRILTIGDKLLILCVLMIVIGFFIERSLGANPRGNAIVVELAGQRQGIYALEEAQILRFDGPLGISEVEIGQQAVWIRRAPCANKICMNQGKLYQPNDVIACLPNRLVLRIIGSERHFDGISR